MNFISKPNVTDEERRKRTLLNVPVLVWASLILSLAATYSAWLLMDNSVKTAARSEFHNRATATVTAVEQRMLAYEQMLRGGVGLFKASKSVERDEWHAYVASLNLDQTFPGVQGVGFSQFIAPNELETHQKKMRAEGYPQYTVRPDGKRDIYTAIIYLEPFTPRNQRAFGYDMFSEPVRHAAMEIARDSGQTAVSGKVRLVQETEKDVQAGFLMYLPVYRNGAPIETIEQRRAAIIGYVYSPFRAKNLMHGIIGNSNDDIDLEVFDGDVISTDTLMYDEDGIAHALENEKQTFARMTQQIDVRGHTWTLVITTKPVFEDRIDHGKPLTIAIAGIIISILFSITVWVLSNHRARALALANVMTHTVREREALIEAIVSDAADGIITIDEDGKILSFNRAAETIFGYAPNEILGKNVSLLMPNPHQANHSQYIERYKQSGIKRFIGAKREVFGKRKNDEIFPLDVAISEIKQSGGRIFSGILRDITERVKAQEALQASEERFDLAIKGANDGLWDWNIDSNEVYFSPRWKTMLGYSEYEIENKLEEWSSRVHPDDLPKAMSDVQDHLQGKTPLYINEHRMRHKDGNYVWILDRGIAQRDETGHIHRMVGIHTDITERKRVEKLKSEFVSTVSHELRTPLTSIRGSLGLVSSGVTGDIPGEAKDLIDIAYKNTDRLLALINDLLDMEKIQSGNLEFHFEKIALMPLVEQCIESNRGFAQHFGVNIILDAKISHCEVYVDSGRLTQVLTNLLSNAAKFSRDGGHITVHITSENGKIKIAIRDQGIGIPENFRNRIFQKFSQVDSSDARHKGGTGLGLSISKSLVEKMDGEIYFESETGIGTTFFVCLPAVTAQSPQQANR